jgi:hypothetical protein
MYIYTLYTGDFQTFMVDYFRELFVGDGVKYGPRSIRPQHVGLIMTTLENSESYVIV